MGIDVLETCGGTEGRRGKTNRCRRPLDNFLNGAGGGVDATTDGKDDGRNSVSVPLQVEQLSRRRKGNQRRARDGSRAVDNSSGSSSTDTRGWTGARKRLSFKGGAGLNS